MKIILTIFCILCLFSSLEITRKNYGIGKWYSGYVYFSNWRNSPKCDFSTNVPVHDWYTKSSSASYRSDGIASYVNRIANGETLIVGIDYYALMLSRPYVPPDIINSYGEYLSKGGVLVYKTFKDSNNSGINWAVHRMYYTNKGR